MPSTRSEPAMLLALTLALLGPVEVDARGGTPPIAVLLGLEVDDLDRDIKRQHEALLASRQRLAQTQRMAQRGIASADSVEQEAADARFQAARESEMAAVRVLKAYQRDLIAGAGKGDPEREYALVLDVLKSQEATARVESDFRAFMLKQAQALIKRGAISKAERDSAEVEATSALASVALLKARQARLDLENARRPAAKGAEPEQVRLLEVAHLRAVVEHATLAATAARLRFEQARDRARPPATPSELDPLRKALDEADATLAADRRRLEANDPPPAPVRPASPR